MFSWEKKNNNNILFANVQNRKQQKRKKTCSTEAQRQVARKAKMLI